MQKVIDEAAKIKRKEEAFKKVVMDPARLEAQKKYRETAISDTYTMIVPVSINTIFESI